MYFVKKTNVHRMTKDEYESGNFEPCEICLPDKHVGKETNTKLLKNTRLLTLTTNEEQLSSGIIVKNSVKHMS